MACQLKEIFHDLFNRKNIRISRKKKQESQFQYKKLLN